MSRSKPIESIPVAERLALKNRKSKEGKAKKKVVTDSGFVKFDLDSTLYTYPPVDSPNAHASLNIKRIGLSKLNVGLKVFSKKFVLDWYARTVTKQEEKVSSKNRLKMKSPLVNYTRVLFFLFSFIYFTFIYFLFCIILFILFIWNI